MFYDLYNNNYFKKLIYLSKPRKKSREKDDI